MSKGHQRAFIISQMDNVAVALLNIKGGTSVLLSGANIGQVFSQDTIPEGHKIAIKAVSAGEDIIKGGTPIGYAALDIPVGSHVHTHNICSYAQNAGEEKDGGGDER